VGQCGHCEVGVIPRIRFVVDTDPLRFRYSRPEETARLIQSILRQQLSITDLTVESVPMAAAPSDQVPSQKEEGPHVC
jgi:hypothetical protein